MMTDRPADEKYPVWGFAATLAWGVLIAAVFIFTQLVVMALYLGIVHGDLPQAEYELMLIEVQHNGTPRYGISLLWSEKARIAHIKYRLFLPCKKMRSVEVFSLCI